MSEEVIPRDAKIVHLLLASMGITSYQDQVPLQLLDFAHRYTTQILQDAQIYSDYAHQSGASQPAGMNAQNSSLTIDDLKLAVTSRVAYQFKPTTPKDLLVTLAAERNKRNLPAVPASYGLRLPPEKHCLTGNERDIDEDEDVVIAGYEKISLSDGNEDVDMEDEQIPSKDEVNDADPDSKSSNNDEMDTS